MYVPDYIRKNPNYPLLAPYFSREEVIEILESGIPLNRPGFVPSIQVPPGAKGCEGLGNVLPSLPISQPWSEDLLTVLTSGCMCVTSPCTCGQTTEPVTTPQPVSVPSPDPTLRWVEDNWVMIAGALGGLLILSMVMKK